MNYALLKYELEVCKVGLNELCKKLKLSRSALYRKMTGKSDIELDILIEAFVNDFKKEYGAKDEPIAPEVTVQMQYAKFPMQYVNVAQVPNNAFSHKGSVSAFDNAGKDLGIDDVFAPFDCRVVWKDTGSAKTGVVIQNTVDVKCADGIVRKPNTIKVLLWHDNDISNLWLGKEIKQGEVFYQDGTAGRATGNHVHFNVGIGAHDGKYPMVKNQSQVWEIKGEIDPTKIFFIDDSHIVKNTKGMRWKKYTPSKEEVPSLKDSFKVGKRVRLKPRAVKYATGQRLPSWVKLNEYTIQSIRADRILLKEIMSWVLINDCDQVD